MFFRPPKYILHLFIMSLSLQSFHIPKRSMRLCKKRDTWSSQNNKRKKWNTWRFQDIEKKEIAHTSKAISKREKVMIKGVPKILGLGKYSTHLHILIKVYDLHLLESDFWLSNICDVSMPLILTYLQLHSKPFRDRMKRRQNNQMPWWGSYTSSVRVNHLRNSHFIFQNS